MSQKKNKRNLSKIYFKIKEEVFFKVDWTKINKSFDSYPEIDEYLRDGYDSRDKHFTIDSNFIRMLKLSKLDESNEHDTIINIIFDETIVNFLDSKPTIKWWSNAGSSGGQGFTKNF